MIPQKKKIRKKFNTFFAGVALVLDLKIAKTVELGEDDLVESGVKKS